MAIQHPKRFPSLPGGPLTGYAVAILTALVTLVLFVLSTATFRSGIPYYGFEIGGVGGHVTAIDTQGPAADTGLEVTDRVVAIDGTPVFRYLVLPPVAPGQESARVLTYIREGQHYDVAVTPGHLTPRERAFNITRLFIGLVFWMVGITVWAMRPGNRVRRLFFLMGQLVAAMLFLDVMDPGVVPAVLGSDVLMLFMGPIVMHFCSVFPHPVSEALRKRLLVAAYGGASLLAAIALVIAPIVPAVAASTTLQSVEGAFAIAALSLGLFLLMRPERHVALGIRRRRRVVITGMLVGVAPVLLLTRVPMLLTSTPLATYEATVPFLALVPLAYAYAFYKGELGTTDFILNRTLVYLLLTTLLVALYASIIYGMRRVFPLAESSTYIIATAALLVLAGVVFAPVRDRLQRAVDRLFYAGWYDYRTVVRGVSEELSRTIDRPRLIEQLKTVVRTMRFDSGAIFWPADDKLHVAWADGPSRQRWGRLRPSIGGDFVIRLLAEDRLLEGTLALTPDGREVFDPLPEAGTAIYWLPLVHDGRLRGVLSMADRQADELLGREDVDILQTLARQAAVAATNIHLLEDLEARLAEVETARDALAEAQRRVTQAREAERARIARELHDGPIQDLYTVGHGLEEARREAPPTQVEGLSHLDALIRSSAERLRSICTELRPPLLAELGFESALRAYAAEFASRHPAIEVELRMVHGPVCVVPEVELALFRICQEALHNVAAHARARHVSIASHVDARRILLLIEDDGCGFDVPSRWTDFAVGGHLGLLGMAERAEIIGATFEVISRPGAGTTVRTSIPVTQNATA